MVAVLGGASDDEDGGSGRSGSETSSSGRSGLPDSGSDDEAVSGGSIDLDSEDDGYVPAWAASRKGRKRVPTQPSEEERPSKKGRRGGLAADLSVAEQEAIAMQLLLSKKR